MSLGSIQDIIQSALGKTYSIADEDLKNIIESQLKLIPPETDERWRIRSNVSPLDLPATASPKEVDDAIRNHLKREADADDAYFYSGATGADRLRIFEERVENEKNQLTYHIPINKSNGSIQDYTAYDLSGDANGNVVISGHHRGTLNNEKLAELDRLKNAINGSVFGRKKRQEAFENALNEHNQTYDKPIFSNSGFNFISSGNHTTYSERDSSEYLENSVAPAKSEGGETTYEIDGNGNTNKITRTITSTNNPKNKENGADNIKSTKVSDTLTCENGEDVNINTKTTITDKTGKETSRATSSTFQKDPKEPLTTKPLEANTSPSPERTQDSNTKVPTTASTQPSSKDTGGKEM